MIVSVLQDKLAKGLAKLAGSVEARPILPVLGNILLKVEDAVLTLTATNLETSVTVRVGAKVDMEGPGITLPYKTLSDLVKKFSAEHIDIKVDYPTQTATLKCGASRSEIKGITVDEFPKVPEFAGPHFEIPAPLLRHFLSRAGCAAAREENRPILCGIHLECDGQKLNVTSADGYRLYVNTVELDTPTTPFLVTLPVRSMEALVKLLKDEDDMIQVNTGGVRDIWQFQLKHAVFSTQLLEGKFPDVTAIIPATYSTRVVLYTADLKNMIDRAHVFSKDSANSVKMTIMPPTGPNEPGQLTIYGFSAERGMLESMLDATVEGDPLEVSFNSLYMTEHPYDAEQIVIESNGKATPIVMREENNPYEIYLTMPMSVQR